MAMRPEDVPAELVTKIETAVSLLPGWVLGEPDTAALHVVAALIPEIQALALQGAAEEMRRRDDHFSWDEIHRGSEWLDDLAARLTATTEEPTT